MNDRFHTEEDSQTPGFPLWAYLNQPLFHPAQPFFARPRRFWRYYNISAVRALLAAIGVASARTLLATGFKRGRAINDED